MSLPSLTTHPLLTLGLSGERGEEEGTSFFNFRVPDVTQTPKNPSRFLFERIKIGLKAIKQLSNHISTKYDCADFIDMKF